MQVHHNDWKPALSVGDYVWLQPDGRGYLVDALEVIPTIDIEDDLPDVDDGDVANDVELRSLYLKDGVLGQYRFFDQDGTSQIDSGVEFTIQQGGEEQRRHTTKNNRGVYNENTAEYGENAQMTELWQFQDDDLFTTITNGSGGNLTASDLSIEFVGFQYDLVQSDVSRDDVDVVAPTGRIRLGK